MSEHSRDDELLKTFLSGDSELSRHYREKSAEEPPAHVDAAIIASARWAVGADRRSADRKDADNRIANSDVSAGKEQPDQADETVVRQPSFLAQWRMPLAMAAVVVIAATLTLMIERNPESDRIGDTDDSASIGDLARNEVVSPEQASEPEPTKPVAAVPATTARPLAKKDSVKAEAAKRQAVSQAATKPAPPAKAAEEPAKTSGSEAGGAPKEKRAVTSVVAREAAEPTPQAVETPGAASVQESAPSISAGADGETAGRDTDAAVASYAGAAFPSAGNLGASSGERRDQPTASADAGMPAETEQTAAAPAAAEGEQASAAAASDETANRGNADTRDPQQWIKDINDLLAQGERAKAIDSLEQFRRKYPDYQLTPELRALLPADSR